MDAALLTATICLREMLTIAELEAFAQWIETYNATDDDFLARFWCDGRFVTIGPFKPWDRRESLDTFSAKWLAPAMRIWQYGGGDRSGPQDIRTLPPHMRGAQISWGDLP